MYLSSERAAEPSLSHLRRSIEQAYEDGQKARAENESLVRSPERETPERYSCAVTDAPPPPNPPLATAQRSDLESALDKLQSARAALAQEKCVVACSTSFPPSAVPPSPSARSDLRASDREVTRPPPLLHQVSERKTAVEARVRSRHLRRHW
jgi:hypothetical protein